MSQIYDGWLDPYGVTITQFGLLAHIGRMEGVSIGALAAELVMDPTTLTRNLTPLRRRNLVALRPSAQDKRVQALSLTPEGKEMLALARPGWQEAQRQLAATLGSDLAPLSGAIDRMLERLSE